MTITTDQLRRWAEALCTLEHADAASAARALGLGTYDEGPTWVVVTAPPAGATSFKLAKRDGQIDYVAIELAGPTRADFDAAFGAGNELPLMPPALLRQVLYRVTVPGAPFTCAVIPIWQPNHAPIGAPPRPPAPPGAPLPPGPPPSPPAPPPMAGAPAISPTTSGPCTEVTLRRDRAVSR